tara:strand:- start:6069 stop:6806 length:738 start_codon:yes stop_codon:yes gene_type:complete
MSSIVSLRQSVDEMGSAMKDLVKELRQQRGYRPSRSPWQSRRQNARRFKRSRYSRGRAKPVYVEDEESEEEEDPEPPTYEDPDDDDFVAGDSEEEESDDDYEYEEDIDGFLDDENEEGQDSLTTEKVINMLITDKGLLKRPSKKSVGGGVFFSIVDSGDEFTVQPIKPSKTLAKKKVGGCVHHAGGWNNPASVTVKVASSALRDHQSFVNKGQLDAQGRCPCHWPNWKDLARQHGSIAGACIPIF